VSASRRAYSAIAAALTIEPRRIPAADPVSLDSETPPIGPDLHLQAARVFESRNDIQQALTHYEAALNASPNDPKTLLAVARLYDRHDEWTLAESYYMAASNADPENSGILNDLALCYARQRKYAEAVATMQFAIQQFPTNPRYRNNIAAVLIEAGQFEHAYQHLASVHSEAVARYNLGYLLSKRGFVEPAIHQMRLALQVDPTFAAARQRLESLGELHDDPGTPAMLISGGGQRPALAPPVTASPLRRLPPV
jgi:tetratricopeptide (TPR) repeat protein